MDTSRRTLQALVWLISSFCAQVALADDCKVIASKLLSTQPAGTAWTSSPVPLQPPEKERLNAAQTVNPMSITVERLKTGTTYRIVASDGQAAVHAYTYDGAIDYIGRFANEVGRSRLMIYLHGFDKDQSESVRQTLRAHSNTDRAYFLEAGPDAPSKDMRLLVERHPTLGDAKISGDAVRPNELMFSVNAPLKESATTVTYRAMVRLSGTVHNLQEFVTALINRLRQVLLGLPANADVHMTAMAIQQTLNSEFARLAKQTGVAQKDLRIQIGLEGRDIYISMPGGTSITGHLARGDGTCIPS